MLLSNDSLFSFLLSQNKYNIPIISTSDIPNYYVWDLNAHTQPSPLFDSLHLVGTQYMFVKFKSPVFLRHEFVPMILLIIRHLKMLFHLIILFKESSFMPTSKVNLRLITWYVGNSYRVKSYENVALNVTVPLTLWLYDDELLPSWPQFFIFFN